ncbi:MAG: undecaprenyl-diphosphate phosphatase [Bacteroidota bacterium]
MTWLEGLILGLIQGLTEFLPVSSSGHLEIGNVLLGVEAEDHLLFTVLVHAATAISTVIVFRKEIGQLLQGLLKFRWNESWQFAVKIIISMIPVAIVGLFFEEDIEQLFSGNLLLVGGCLMVTSALLFFTYLQKSNEKEVSYIAALVIGLAQAFAVLPGISRSGATIATALLLGIDKSKATRFSFLMVLVPILGAALLKTKDYMESPEVAGSIATSTLAVGFVAALLAGYAACRWMLNIVRQGKLTYFALYCLIVGLIAIVSQL